MKQGLFLLLAMLLSGCTAHMPPAQLPEEPSKAAPPAQSELVESGKEETAADAESQESAALTGEALAAAWTTFTYEGVSYDLRDRSPSINAITDCIVVGEKVVIECHVGPHNGVYCIFDTVAKTFEEDLIGHNLIWKGEDVTTAVYGFWDQVYAYDGTLLRDLTAEIQEGDFLYDLAFTQDGTAVEATICPLDGEEYVITIPLPT